MSAAIAVTVARIDLQKPAGTYKPGDTKELVYTYMENGNIVDIGTAYTLTPLKKPDSAGNYVVGEKFSQEDAGDWTMQISYALENKGGHGTVSGSRDFTVTGDGGGAIIPSRADADIIIPGEEYTCGTSGQDFNMVLSGIEFYHSKEQIDWWIEGNSEVSLVQAPGNGLNNSAATIVAREGAGGFVLCARYTKYTDWNGSAVEKVITAKKYISVVKEVHISTIPEEIIPGEKYQMGMEITISGVKQQDDGSYVQEEEKIYAQNELNAQIAWEVIDNPSGKTYFPFNGVECWATEDLSGETLKLKGKMWDMDQIVKNFGNHNLTDTITIRVK